MKNTKQYLSGHYDFCCNQINRSIYYRKKGEETYRIFDSRAEKSLIVEMDENFVKSNSAKLDTLLKSDFCQEFDPIADYFKSLKWDGDDHLSILTRSIKTDDDEFFEVALKKYLLNALNGWLKPDKYNEHMLVLAGEQNVGKSTLARNLIPPCLKDYLFQGSLLANKNDFMKQLSRKMIIILDEFDGVSGKDIPWLKELITREIVETRLAYQKHDMKEVRRASFIATTNVTQPLRDLSGNRRMLSFYIKSIDRAIVVKFDQVWAQLYYMYNTNEEFVFTDDDNKYIRKRNERFTYRDIVAEAILQKFEKTDDNTCRFTNIEIARMIRADIGAPSISQSVLTKIGITLNQMGFVKRKSNGSQYYQLKKRAGSPTKVLSTAAL